MNTALLPLHQSKIAVIGLGYVGLPLAVELAKYYPTVGYDISPKRIEGLEEGHDFTLEVEDEKLQSSLVKSSIGLDHKGKGFLPSNDVSEISS